AALVLPVLGRSAHAAPPAPGDATARPAQENLARPTGKARLVDRVVAIVNDSVILRSELLRRVAPLTAEVQRVADRSERERRLARLEGEVLEEMVNEELIAQAAEEAHLEV